MRFLLVLLGSIAAGVVVSLLISGAVIAVMVRPYFTRRRWLMVRTRRAECVGGPFDGMDLPVSLAVALSWSLMEWPNVFYNAYTKTYQLAGASEHRRRVPGNLAATWAGYYRMTFGGDRFTWESTELAAHADVWLAELRSHP